MKNKNNIILIIGIMMIIIGVCLMVFSGTGSKIMSKSNYTQREVLNLRETNKELPKFSIAVTGAYEGPINNTNIKEYGIKVYEFDAVIDNGWDLVKNHYVGFRLTDALSAFSITDYSSIEFTSSYNVRIKYGRNEITNNAFIVFYKDGKLLDENNPVEFLSVDNEYRYSVDKLINMDFVYTADVYLNDTDDKDNNNND